MIAAGQSKRFGGDKRQARLKNGCTVLRQSWLNMNNVFSDCVLILRPEEKPDKFGISNNINYLLNEKYFLGISESIKLGFSYIQNTLFDSACILLGDMPWIELHTLKSLNESSCASKIIAPVYKDQIGHPVFFGKNYWNEILSCSGDMGAKKVIYNNLHNCTFLTVNDNGVIKDIDYKKDLYI